MKGEGYSSIYLSLTLLLNEYKYGASLSFNNACIEFIIQRNKQHLLPNLSRIMASKPYPHVLIVGAGLSGLTLAQILRKNRVSYEIFERDKSAEARAQGWAIALHGPVLADLQEHLPDDIGPIECTNHLTPLDHLPAQFVFYHTEKPDMRIGVEDDDKGKIVRANRQRLRDWLRTHISVQYDSRAVKVEEDEQITVHFENGTSATGDILVGAEGSRSAIRKHILRGQDVMRPLPIGSLVGEVELTGDDFARQLELAHSAYVVLDNGPASLFAALNKVSPDGKIGYWYFILHWVDAEAAKATDENPFWTVNASREDLAAFVRDRVKDYPDHLRVLVDKTPVERYKRPGIVLQGVELNADQLPAERVMLIGDAAHSMTPCEFLSLSFKLPVNSFVYRNRTNELCRSSPRRGWYKCPAGWCDSWAGNYSHQRYSGQRIRFRKDHGRLP